MRQLPIVSSACHGVEGHCGSGVQVAVLYIHALNPHGFSHSRRVTHENVDLNRNFQRFFDPPLPVNAAYDTLHDLLLPEQWPPVAANQATLASWIAENGMLREHGQGAKHVAWIDLHTGLGPSGVSERIWAGMNDAPAIARARQWWGNDGATPITSIYEGTSTSALLTGLMWPPPNGANKSWRRACRACFRRWTD